MIGNQRSRSSIWTGAGECVLANVVAGVAQPLATILTARIAGQSYDVGKPNTFQIVDLDGAAGPRSSSPT
jgi:hypothetical protein